VTLVYRRVHCCNRVASKALVILMAKLEIQSEFTQMAYLGGENVESSFGPGLRSWIDTVINAARAAENKPVYSVSLVVAEGCVNRNKDTRKVQSPLHPFDGVWPSCCRTHLPSVNKERREALRCHKTHPLLRV